MLKYDEKLNVLASHDFDPNSLFKVIGIVITEKKITFHEYLVYLKNDINSWVRYNEEKDPEKHFLPHGDFLYTLSSKESDGTVINVHQENLRMQFEGYKFFMMTREKFFNDRNIALVPNIIEKNNYKAVRLTFGNTKPIKACDTKIKNKIINICKGQEVRNYHDSKSFNDIYSEIYGKIPKIDKPNNSEKTILTISKRSKRVVEALNYLILNKIPITSKGGKKAYLDFTYHDTHYDDAERFRFFLTKEIKNSVY